MCLSESRDLLLITEDSVTSAGRLALWMDSEALEGVTRDHRGDTLDGKTAICPVYLLLNAVDTADTTLPNVILFQSHAVNITTSVRREGLVFITRENKVERLWIITSVVSARLIFVLFLCYLLRR